MINLRDYQREAIDNLMVPASEGHRRLLLQAACGAGKTVIAAQIIRHAVSNNQRVLFLAHRRELVMQCAKKLSDFGVESGQMISGEEWDQTHLVDVASIQTLHSWCIRRGKYPAPPADLVVIDEAHHYNSSRTWQEVVEKYPEALILGMTATPCNKRGKGLGYHFDAMVKCPSIQKLIDQGFLVPAKYYVPSVPDLEGLKVMAGDYAENQLSTRMDVPKLIGDIVENWARIAPTRKTMIFASGVKHSIHLVEAFSALGVKAAHVDGKTAAAERDAIIKRFSDGDLQILSNCAVFTEGTDIPAASCLIFARPTKSLLLYLQVAGRVLRTHPGKEDAIIIDHAGVFYEHGPIAQDWPWKLDYGKGDVQKENGKRRKKEHKPITCESCKYVYEQRLDCPKCGWKPKVNGKEVLTYPAYLQAVDELANTPPDVKRFYQMMLHVVKSNGYKIGYVWMKCKDRFGPSVYCPRAWMSLEPIEPSLEVIAWLAKERKKYFFRKNNPGLAAHVDGLRGNKSLQGG